jgi:predicted nuclease of predicted toxin-antitoxin system
MLRLLTDENLDGRITAGLLQVEPMLPLVRVQDVGLSGTDDPTVLAWAAAQDCLLLTHDRKTIPGFAVARILAGQRMPGVVVVAASCPLRVAIDALLLLALASFPGEWEGQILSIP